MLKEAPGQGVHGSTSHVQESRQEVEESIYVLTAKCTTSTYLLPMLLC